MATSFFYIYIDMYKLMERPVVLLNAIFPGGPDDPIHRTMCKLDMGWGCKINSQN